MTSTNKKESFLICITIIEGKLFSIANMHSVVEVRIDRKKRATCVRKGTDCPYYNEYFVFEFETTLENLLDKTINLNVIQPRSCSRSRAVLGYFNLDLSTLWLASEHQYYHKWAVLNAINKGVRPELLGPRGYLKIDVAIQSKGQAPLVPILKQDATNDIESNLLVPENVSFDRTRAKFTIYIYRADVLLKPKVNVFGKQQVSSPNCYVEITFAGMNGKTSVCKNTTNPVWNEKIVITEYFPSLSQRFKIELKSTNNNDSVTYYMYTKDISNDGDYGYLPCFGPSYIYLYGPGSTDQDYEFKGRLLLEIRTEILKDLMWSTNNVEIILIRQPYLAQWKMEPIFLFDTIYSVTMINKKYQLQDISFELTLGFVLENDDYSENITTQMKCQPDNSKIYWHLPLGNHILCLSNLSVWPDQRDSVYNSNMIQYIYDKLESGLEKIHDSMQLNEKDLTLKLFADTLINDCKTYLLIAKAMQTPITESEQKRLQLCIKEIGDIETLIKEFLKIPNGKKQLKSFKILCHRIYSLIDHVQSCWPDIFLWMLVNNKRVGLYRLPIKEVIFSKIPEQKGNLCGKIQTTYMKPTSNVKLPSGENTSYICKLVHQLWIGLACEKENCFKNIPSFYKPDRAYNIPTRYICDEQHHFKCIVHVYQGEFLPGADDTGLSDPFVQVVIQNYCVKTKAIPKTIHPLWDQTLVCNDVIVYGTLDYLKSHIPEINLEVYDQDYHIFLKQEYEGSCSLTPEIYFQSENVPTAKLKCCKVYNAEKEIGEILVAAQLILKSESEMEITGTEEHDFIPAAVKPGMKSFKMDVYFWGTHNSKNMRLIKRPKIVIECGSTILTSSAIQDVFKNSNFTKPIQSIIFQMPEKEDYYPTLTVKLFDSKGFGYNSYIGVSLTKVQNFFHQPMINSDRYSLLTTESTNDIQNSETSSQESSLETTNVSKTSFGRIKNALKSFRNKIIKASLWFKKNKKIEQRQEEEYDNLTRTADWWTKFYISLKKGDIEFGTVLSKTFKLKIYSHALEDHKEFEHFSDLLKPFPIYRGKRTGDEVLDEGNIVSTFKGAIKIYPWPEQENIRTQYVTDAGLPLSKGFFQHFPPNDPVAFVARVYVVRGLKLRPKDLSGKSDPYIIVKMSKQVINDKDKYIANQIDPVFGRCFELKGVFPNDHKITIEVWDWDIASKDDFIGETCIDIENRLYTFHRAHCGIAKEYISYGPCAWRDQFKPSQILELLCRRNNLIDPVYLDNAVKVGPCIFKNDKPKNSKTVIQKEILSLLALNHWKEIPIIGCILVPEHVETRSLHHYSKPGLEQGKLQLWVDIFPQGDLPPPPPVDISPRLSQLYELRIIIWNTEDVILDEDDFFVGEKKSDIYVLGWLTDWKVYQYTDVHYNSISGEGNFNWRFIFKFEYLDIEDKIVVRKKEHVFSKDETEFKIPCRLHLQVWDNDTFSADDFLGALHLRLSHLPRGAKTSNRCNLKNLKSEAPVINLFKIKRHKGWWPFKGRCKKNNKEILTGKAEIEFDLLTEEEANKFPAGLGRSEPQGLPKPNDMRLNINLGLTKSRRST